jgi:hypothetical protein
MDLPRLAWLFSCVGIAVANIYLMCLWIFAAIRTRLLCFMILACTASLWALFSIVAALLSFDPAIIRFLDPTFYRLFRIWFFVIQPFVACVGLVGSTLVVGRMLHHERQATPTA